MPHYKDTENRLHFLDDAAFSHMLPPGSVAITDAEADALRAPLPPTIDELKAANMAEVQKQLDATALAHGYDDIVSAVSYAACPGPFQADGVAFSDWRSAVWLRAIEIEGEIMAGKRPMPTPAEAVALMPAFAFKA